MKQILIGFLFVVLVAVGFAGEDKDACTSITVGKLASVDGSVMTSHTCDSREDRTWIDIVPARKYKPGAKRKTYVKSHLTVSAYDLSKHLEMTQEVRPLLIDLFSKKNIYPIFHQFTGNCIFTHKEKFLKKLSDWKGAKMRLAGRWQSTLGKKWGASPVFLPPPELYLACQRGVIDGFMLIYDITYGLKLYEVTPYITDTTFSNNIEIVTMNLNKWKSLTKEDQKIFKDVVKDLASDIFSSENQTAWLAAAIALVGVIVGFWLGRVSTRR